MLPRVILKVIGCRFICTFGLGAVPTPDNYCTWGQPFGEGTRGRSGADQNVPKTDQNIRNRAETFEISETSETSHFFFPQPSSRKKKRTEGGLGGIAPQETFS